MSDTTRDGQGMEGMDRGEGMGRREFLSQLALLGAAVASFRCAEPKESGLELRPPLPPEASAPFTQAQRAALAAACGRILPGGDGIPGAAEAGVIEFAAAELRRPELGEIRKRIDGGLLALDRRSARSFAGKRFADLGAEEQDGILRETQVGSLQGEEFLRILISLTLEGFLGDPAYGGNRGAAGWKVIGAAPTSERGRLEGVLGDRAAAHAEAIGRAPSAPEASR